MPRSRWRAFAALFGFLAAMVGVLPPPCAAHPAAIAAATAKVGADGRFEVQARFDLLAFALDDTPFRIGDGPMNALLDGPSEALQTQLDEAQHRFRRDFQVSGGTGPGAVDTVTLPSVADVQHWRDSGVKPRLPVMMNVVVQGHLPPGATTASFRFPEVLGTVVVTTEIPNQEPFTEPVEGGAFSTPVPLAPPPLPAPAQTPPVLAAPAPPPPPAAAAAVSVVKTVPAIKNLFQKPERGPLAPNPGGTRGEAAKAAPGSSPAPPELGAGGRSSPPPSTVGGAGGGSEIGSKPSPHPLPKPPATALQPPPAPPLTKSPTPPKAAPTPAPPPRVQVMTVAAPRPQIAWGTLVWRYVKMGYAHILPEGLDHILFVLGLFLLSNRLKPLLWQITAFTVAHSLTLALSLYGIVRLPSSIIEPIIAASIAFVAIENLFTTELKPWRPFVVFGFGLVHGMGFAGALKDLGLQRHDFLTALVGFNAGVELGQLSVVGLALLAVGWFRQRSSYRRLVVVPASVLIAMVAVFWTFQRIL